MASNLLKRSDLQFPFTRGANERQRHVAALSWTSYKPLLGTGQGGLDIDRTYAPPVGIEIIEGYGKVGEM
jgi:hypothetical protein